MSMVTIIASMAALTTPGGDAPTRLQQVVDANIVAIHAYQCGMAVAAKTSDPAWNTCGLTTNELNALVQHQVALLAEPPQAIKAWVEGGASAFDPAKDLEPLLQAPLKPSATNLPLAVFAAFLSERTHAPALRVRALASLLQMEMDSLRDGDRLQALYTLYVALGLPAHTAQLGLPARTDEEFLSIGRELAPQLCGCPFKTSPAVLQMQLRKMWNWGHRHTGERDRFVVARELLQEPAVAALTPRLKALPAQKIAVVGHSYTMDVHWASPSAAVPIAAALLREVNPKIEVRQWQAGGMSAGRADCRKFCEEALAWKPNRILLVVGVQTPADVAALEKEVQAFRSAGIPVAMFDTLHGNLEMKNRHDAEAQSVRELAVRTGMTVIPLGQRIDAAPERAHFVSLDGIHMTEPYHRLMATAWLEYLATAP